MLKDEIRARFKQAMKARDTVSKEILRVAIGEIDVAETRANAALDDAAVEKILRKLVKSNRETIKLSADDQDTVATLTKEIEVLETFLPKALGEDEVIAALAEVADAIVAANNDGQATGVAMKHLKSSNAVVDGKTVSGAVRKMRAG